MPVSKKSQSGFTLVELLVAVVILAIGLLGMAQLQVTAIKANSQSATTSAASALAQRVIEEVAAAAADDSRFSSPSSGFVAWSTAPISVAGSGDYDITYQVVQVKAGSDDVTNLYRINIRVESTASVMHVLGNRSRVATATTLKRTF